MATLARTLNCLKPVEQESQGINTLAALNHPHLRNEHRAWCLGETKMTGAEGPEVSLLPARSQWTNYPRWSSGPSACPSLPPSSRSSVPCHLPLSPAAPVPTGRANPVGPFPRVLPTLPHLWSSARRGALTWDVLSNSDATCSVKLSPTSPSRRERSPGSIVLPLLKTCHLA